ncbi:unnamed protein product, partial [Rotaria sordida]
MFWFQSSSKWISKNAAMKHFFTSLFLTCFLNQLSAGLSEQMTSCQSGQMTMGYCDYSNGWPFQQIPSLVHVGLSMIDTQSHDRNVRIQVSAESITPYGFNLRFRSWDDSFTHNAGVS